MATKVTIQVEKGKQEKNFSCFMVENLPDFGLAGYGNTAKQAIEDMYVAQKEIKELLEEERWNFAFLPLKMERCSGAPGRAVAWVEE